MRRRVAPIHKTVDENVFNLLLLGHLQQREEMVDVRVYAAVAKQSHQVQLPLPAAFHRLLEKRHVLQLLVGDQQIDARDVHVHDAPRADIEVPDLAVAHLPFRQADIRAGSVNQRIGEFLEQRVISGFARESDGVAMGFGAVTPAVEHSEHNWFQSLGHSWSGYMERKVLAIRGGGPPHPGNLPKEAASC